MGKKSICRQVLTLKSAFIAIFLLLALGFASCEKENNIENDKTVDDMELFFIESNGLPETSMDSVKSFTSKFGSYVKANPASTKSEYYNPTVENISYACSVFGYKLTVNTGVSILVNDEWDGEYFMNF